MYLDTDATELYIDSAPGTSADVQLDGRALSVSGELSITDANVAVRLEGRSITARGTANSMTAGNEMLITSKFESCIS